MFYGVNLPNLYDGISFILNDLGSLFTPRAFATGIYGWHVLFLGDYSEYHA